MRYDDMAHAHTHKLIHTHTHKKKLAAKGAYFKEVSGE